MRAAGRLYRLHLLVAALGVLFLGVAVAMVIVGSDPAWPSGGEVARACQNWLSSGGPAAVVGLAIMGLALAGLALAIRSVRRQVRNGRAYLASVGPAREAIVDGVNYRELDCDRPLAFCAGYLRPRIYVSRVAIAELPDRQRRAVLAHESHHVRRRDPLRRLLACAIGEALFFVPILRRSSERYAALGELAADEAAVADLGDRRPLAAALLKFSEAEPAPAPAAGIDPERVDHLLGSAEAGRWRLDRGALVLSIAALAALGLIVGLVWQGVVQPKLTLPLVLAGACMVGMVAGPLILGGATLVVSRRALLRRS